MQEQKIVEERILYKYNNTNIKQKYYSFIRIVLNQKKQKYKNYFHKNMKKITERKKDIINKHQK